MVSDFLSDAPFLDLVSARMFLPTAHALVGGVLRGVFWRQIRGKFRVLSWLEVDYCYLTDAFGCCGWSSPLPCVFQHTIVLGGVLNWLFHQAVASPIISGHAPHTPDWSYSIKGTMVFLLIMINLKLIHVTISVAT